ncbi:periplasmic beta-glucosidase [Verticillium alfalfae VaMs.102]|uniref:beta-glucosidase n=1 Tax=Verticillium alfalfae (strain VaMs.102 / ATCC MYA-4576 / FGSC 10136) TaxID=526221 RepID=C9SDP4_VERA1|nr:periplasmic beta-glucosidase [Verticillium alfalfae VaMs.102]EEY17164.1 periplasmic beta-glucosidase [Verticillium alfalfae VaMs.102]
MFRCALTSLALLGSATGFTVDFRRTSNGSLSYKDPSLSPKERAQDLLERMTWVEKVGQLGGIRRAVSRTNGKPVFNETSFNAIRKTQNGQLGLGLQFNYVNDVLPIINDLRAQQVDESRLGIPYITIADSVNGMWISGGTLFPGTASMSSSWNLPLFEQVAAVIREENLAIGVQWVLSPEVDLAKDPRNGRNGEMYGEDGYLVGEFATKYIQTMQEKDENGWVKVATTIKHWVYGSGSGGVNRASMQGGINHILNDLAPPYVKAIRDAKPLALMASYSSVDRIPLSINRYLLQTVLRGILGFKGLIMSDANAIEYLTTESKVASSRSGAALKALRAGLEHELHPGGNGLFTELINQANETDVVALVDTAVLALLEIKFTTGSFDRPLPSLEQANKTLRSEEHLDVNRNITRESIVLLKNDGILPLERSEVGSIAVIGPYADIVNAGMYAACNATDPAYGASFRHSLEREIGAENVRFVQGTSILPSNDTSTKGIVDAAAAAQGAGFAVVVLGSGLGTFDPATFNNERTDGEGYAHADLGFPGQQQQLLDAVLNTGVPTILVLSSGQTFLLSESTQRSGAIMHSWLSGEFTGDALVEILFGETNPSGKLTVTVPQANGAFPVAYDYLPSDDVGGFGSATLYDWHWPQLTRYSPLRFGFGLNYTTFAFGEAEAHSSAATRSYSATSVVVTTSLTNTGDRTGKEVVQLYYRPKFSVIEFPVMKLIRFTKIELGAGESTDVRFEVPMSELGYFVNGEWHVDDGGYSFWIGNSSRKEDLELIEVTV